MRKYGSRSKGKRWKRYGQRDGSRSRAGCESQVRVMLLDVVGERRKRGLMHACLKVHSWYWNLSSRSNRPLSSSPTIYVTLLLYFKIRTFCRLMICICLVVERIIL